MNSLRKDALLALVDIVEEGAYANLRLKQIKRSPQDTAFIGALVYASLEHLKWCDYMLSHYVKPQKKLARNILRMSLAELFFMSTPEHAAVNAAVELCKECGKGASSGLVNAVLRHILNDKDSLPPLPDDPLERLSVQFSCPKWALSEWLQRFGEADTEAMLSLEGPGMEVRAQYPYSSEALANALKVPYQRGKLDNNCFKLEKSLTLSSLPLFREGKIAVQGEGAMAICRFLGDVEGKRVLDACAAPGGKSAYLYSLTRGNIDLSCLDVHPHRVSLMSNTFTRLGVKASCVEMDATLPCEKFEKQFDAVLVDAPCTGLGLLREKPDLGLSKKETDRDSLAPLQQKLLNACCAYVKEGGTLVYSTCTVSQKENEEQVRAFLEMHPAFRLEAQRQLLPHIDGTGGFYMARMRLCT